MRREAPDRRQRTSEQDALVSSCVAAQEGAEGGMSTARVRFGIVGTGGIANTHAAGLAALAEDAELVACCDVVPERVASFGERWGVRHQYDSARAMLDAGGIDVVCVCTPHPQHAEALVLGA